MLIKPVEGPQGPHLFRRSQSSAEFVFDFALQMSPLDVPAKGPSPGRGLQKSTSKSRRYPKGLTAAILPGIPGLPRELCAWSSDDVVDWMFSTGIELGIIRLFRENDITGPVLIDMSFENLKDLGVQSFGKRHQLWSSICSLKEGNSADGTTIHSSRGRSLRASPTTTTDEHDELQSLCSDTSMEDLTPDPAASLTYPRARKARRQRKPHPYQPLDLIDCVGIEYTLPKEHKCKKGQACRSWQRWYRKVQRAKKFAAELNECIPKSNGAIDDVDYPTVPPQSMPYDFVSVSEGIPSIIASSDVLGPGQLSAIALQETALQHIQQRDPQENVKHFLQFQHIIDPIETQAPQEHQAFEERTFETFPSTYHQPHATPLRQSEIFSRDHRTLPRLLIPRAETASPSFPAQPSTFQSPIRVRSPQSALSEGRSVHFSSDDAFRTVSPASELCSPGPNTLDAAVMRDFSQSVPPNMHYCEQVTTPRPPTRLTKRRPSSTLPSVAEDSSLSPLCRPSTHHTSRRTNSDSSSSADLDKQYHARDTYGHSCSHAGYMKKREPLLHLRKWRWGHFRLHGTTLDMHSDQRASSRQLDSINVAEYTVNCCGTNADSGPAKLAAALKSTLRIGEKDPAAFAFQLVPEKASAVDRFRPGGLKTHHFAVGNRDDRIDWMRDLMLAKAKEKRQRGFSVQINGTEMV